ncbi:hypothetical protein GCM10008940_11850 [Microbulbifer agarilyticus]
MQCPISTGGTSNRICCAPRYYLHDAIKLHGKHIETIGAVYNECISACATGDVGAGDAVQSANNETEG